MNRYRLIALAGVLLSGLFVVPLRAAERPGRWYVEANQGDRTEAETVDGVAAASIAFPGSAQLYFERERRTFRPTPEDFRCGELTFEARIVPETPGRSAPVRGHLFVKDKDGFWFQTEEELAVRPGEFQTFRVRLDEPGRRLRPVGHAGLWNAAFAIGILSAGLAVYGDEAGAFRLECRNLAFTGERRRAPLRILNWQLPEEAETFRQLESRFELSRAYFNPFDPDEIKVDFEYRDPDGAIGRFPAFHTLDFRRRLLGTRETLSPVGLPYWAFRFTPAKAGRHALRLVVEDRSGAELVTIRSPWREIEVAERSHRGFVRVSTAHPAYLEFSNGEFFYPVGLNIHTNIDLRSEFRFNFGHLPDRGTYDYDDYFDACGAAGITAVEVWMASWTCAIEWDAAREFYHGLGRYNLANAFRLDHMLRRAGENGIYLNLVLDNHGKTSIDADQEWNDNPFYADAVFAPANGGFLRDAALFFTDPEVKRYNSRRNRYIAARWGADPRILAIELWSEVNLVAGARQALEDGAMAKWHAETAAEYHAMSQAKHLITTHTSGDWRTSLRFASVFEIPEFTHWAGDAYRRDTIHMVDQMREQAENMNFPKPVLITEYGGASQGGDHGKILADVHAGQWSSFFKRQAGSPFLWWHDFVHLHNHYQHYRGFASFIAGLDLRDRSLCSAEPAVVSGAAGAPRRPRHFPAPPVTPGDVLQAQFYPPRYAPYRPPIFHFPPEYRYESLAIGNREKVCGWVFNRQAMFIYPADPAEYLTAGNLALDLPYDLHPGSYRLRFYDTLSGEVRHTARLRHAGGPLRLPLFPFRLDLAYQLEKTE